MLALGLFLKKSYIKSYVTSLIVSGKNKQYRAGSERMGFSYFPTI